MSQVPVVAYLTPHCYRGGKPEVVSFAEDNDRPQSFTLAPDPPNSLDCGVEKLKLTFEGSSDFFGRITIYDLRLEGDIAY